MIDGGLDADLNEFCRVDSESCVGVFNADGETPKIGCKVGSMLAYNEHWARIVIGDGERLIRGNSEARG